MKRVSRACVWLAFLVGVSLPGAVRSAQVVRVGYYDNSPKIFRDGKGRIKGFFPELLEHIATEENWQIQYVPGTWEECLGRLERGGIDLMPDVAPHGRPCGKIPFQ